MISFSVYGNPKTKGNLRPFVSKSGKAIMCRGKSSEEWERLVKFMAQSQRTNDCPWKGPVIVEASFYVQAPKTKKRDFPTTKPDIDKLVRSILDGLSGVIFLDDSQVISLNAHKLYGDPRVEIAVSKKSYPTRENVGESELITRSQEVASPGGGHTRGGVPPFSLPRSTSKEEKK